MTLGLRARSNLWPVAPGNAGAHSTEACGSGFPLARERRRAGGEFALLPLPCGERVGVRGIEAHRETKTPHPPPLPMGEGAERARGECVHAHHLPSAESALAARRRLASSAAVAACARLIQASASARACGGNRAHSGSAPAISPPAAFAPLRAAIAAFRGLLAALERRYAICQGFKLAAHGGRRIGKPLRKLGKRRGARVGARARLARSGKRLLVAAAERNHGLGKRLKLGLERREAVGKRGVPATDGRPGARRRLQPRQAT